MGARTITILVEPDSADTLQVTIPQELREEKLQVTVTIEPVTALGRLAPATPAMLQRRKEAFEALRKANPFRGMQDPVEWQREIRKGRPLAGRN